MARASLTFQIGGGTMEEGGVTAELKCPDFADLKCPSLAAGQ